ncbi:RND transporter [Thiocapsa imhoffii]|uniref:RND transporter n=1 Tax=Thiocapsa imhoffii TaxID=382777 RepID=A0A9X0WJP8_9GAMM|nr:RND transporter [Thiocapsa imhoffii]MBK1646017.1 RND transporter [Thiocapsa imhoffii]
MLNWIDRFPLYLFVVASLTLGLAPFVPEPHLWEKLKMLADGTLTRAIDIFDLLLHATPWVLLVIKVTRQFILPPRTPER